MTEKQSFVGVGLTGVALLLWGMTAWSKGGVTPFPIPSDNPITAPKAKLGKQLFFDKRLSSDGTVSCQTCHDVMKSGTDNLPVSLGVGGKKGTRNSPSVFNAALYSVQFWDGRAPSLEEQATMPMLNPVEMAMPTHQVIVDQVKKVPGYVKEFQTVFGGTDPVTFSNISKAIATYQRTLTVFNSPYDRYLAGDKSALTAKALRGLEKVTQTGCFTCHSGSGFNGPTMTAGQGFYMKFPMIPNPEYEQKYELSKDLGRFETTRQEGDKNLWRVPSWRNIAITGPYFHNGSVRTLGEAVRVMAKTQLNRTLSDIDVEEIVEFMNHLTSKVPRQTEPKLP